MDGGTVGDASLPEDFQRGTEGRFLREKTFSFNQYRTMLAYI